MRLPPCAALAAALALSSPIASADCMLDAPDQKALLECARNEVVPLERKVDQAFSALLEKHKGSAELVEALQASKKTWDAYRNAQCSLAGSAREAAATANRSFEAGRGVMICVRNAFQRRLEELNGL